MPSPTTSSASSLNSSFCEYLWWEGAQSWLACVVRKLLVQEACWFLLLPCHTQEMSPWCQETLSSHRPLTTWLPVWWPGIGDGERWPLPGSELGRTGLSGTITGQGRTAASRGNWVPDWVKIKRFSGNSPAIAGSCFVGANFSLSSSLLSWLANILPLLLQPEVNAFWRPASLKLHHHRHRHRHHHCHHHGNSTYSALAML